MYMYSGGFRGGRGGANEPPFEADNSDFARNILTLVTIVIYFKF